MNLRMEMFSIVFIIRGFNYQSWYENNIELRWSSGLSVCYVSIDMQLLTELRTFRLLGFFANI